MDDNIVKAYLDIEATGLSPTNNEVTIVGILIQDTAGEVYEFKQYVKGINLDRFEIRKFLEYHNVHYLVGYNSNKFDIPFLAKNDNMCCEFLYDYDTIDLMRIAHKLQLKGGLKKLEKVFGIERKYEPLSFHEQMKLWKAWENHCHLDSLDRYKYYNEEDVKWLPTVEQKLEEYKILQKEKNNKMKNVLRNKLHKNQ